MSAKHIKGANNVGADVLSRRFEDVEKESGDGHEWTVSPDWEANTGLANDIFSVCVEAVGGGDAFLVVPLPAGTMALRERLKGEPLFVEVLDAIHELETGTSMRARRRAKHRASEYFVEDRRLWRIGGGAGDRAKAKRE